MDAEQQLQQQLGDAEAVAITECLENPAHYNVTELHMACAQGDLNLIYDILSRYDDSTIGEALDCPDAFGRFPLTYAVVAPPEVAADVIKTLQQCGAGVSDRDSEGRTAGHWACMHGVFESLDVLLSIGLDVGIADNDGRTIAHMAASFPDSACMETLLRYIPVDDPVYQAPDVAGMVPLHMAALSNNVNVMHAMLSAGIPASTVDAQGRTAYHHLSKATDGGCLDLLFSVVPDLVNAPDAEGSTLLHTAVAENNLAMVQLLIPLVPDGVDLNGADVESRTPLLWATALGYVDIVVALLQAGCDYSITDTAGANIFHYAASAQDPTCLEQLLASIEYADTYDNAGQTPLHWAVNGNNKDAAQLLIGAGSAVNAADTKGTTPLLQAISALAMDCVALLIQHGADVNHADAEQKTPLLACMLAEVPDAALITLLLQNGCDAQVSDESGRTALHHAASRGLDDVVAAIIPHATNVDALDTKQATALQYASFAGSLASVRALVEAGADPNLCDEDGVSPLHWAALEGHRDVVDYLIRENVWVNCMEKNGNRFTPLDYAKERGHQDCVRLLRDADAVTYEEMRPIAAQVIQHAYRSYKQNKVPETSSVAEMQTKDGAETTIGTAPEQVAGHDKDAGTEKASKTMSQAEQTVQKEAEDERQAQDTQGQEPQSKVDDLEKARAAKEKKKAEKEQKRKEKEQRKKEKAEQKRLEKERKRMEREEKRKQQGSNEEKQQQSQQLQQPQQTAELGREPTEAGKESGESPENVEAAIPDAVSNTTPSQRHSSALLMDSDTALMKTPTASKVHEEAGISQPMATRTSRQTPVPSIATRATLPEDNVVARSVEKTDAPQEPKEAAAEMQRASYKAVVLEEDTGVIRDSAYRAKKKEYDARLADLASQYSSASTRSNEEKRQLYDEAEFLRREWERYLVSKRKEDEHTRRREAERQTQEDAELRRREATRQRQQVIMRSLSVKKAKRGEAARISRVREVLSAVLVIQRAWRRFLELKALREKRQARFTHSRGRARSSEAFNEDAHSHQLRSGSRGVKGRVGARKQFALSSGNVASLDGDDGRDDREAGTRRLSSNSALYSQAMEATEEFDRREAMLAGKRIRSKDSRGLKKEKPLRPTKSSTVYRGRSQSLGVIRGSGEGRTGVYRDAGDGSTNNGHVDGRAHEASSEVYGNGGVHNAPQQQQQQQQHGNLDRLQRKRRSFYGREISSASSTRSRGGRDEFVDENSGDDRGHGTRGARRAHSSTVLRRQRSQSGEFDTTAKSATSRTISSAALQSYHSALEQFSPRVVRRPRSGQRAHSASTYKQARKVRDHLYRGPYDLFDGSVSLKPAFMEAAADEKKRSSGRRKGRTGDRDEGNSGLTERTNPGWRDGGNRAENSDAGLADVDPLSLTRPLASPKNRTRRLYQ